jgi:hypothetical protein
VILAIDFDGTVVEQGPLGSPLRLIPGVKDALLSLKRAGHVLVLYSARANRARRFDPMLDPLVRAGIIHVDMAQWERDRPAMVRAFDEMVMFVWRELPDVFNVIDDGGQGKPEADMFIDDRMIAFSRSTAAMCWRRIRMEYGVQPVRGAVRR